VHLYTNKYNLYKKSNNFQTLEIVNKWVKQKLHKKSYEIYIEAYGFLNLYYIIAEDYSKVSKFQIKTFDLLILKYIFYIVIYILITVLHRTLLIYLDIWV